MKNLLDKKQAAERLAVCVRTIERLMKEKKLPYVRVTRGAVRFRESDLEAFVERMIVHKKLIVIDSSPNSFGRTLK